MDRSQVNGINVKYVHKQFCLVLILEFKASSTVVRIDIENLNVPISLMGIKI